MFVSLLQLMGFPMGKPVHSRAEETRSDKPLKGRKATAATSDHAQAVPARRQEVNAKSGKDSKVKPAPSKAKPVAKKAATAKAATKAAAAKTPAKPAAKAAAKAPVATKSSSKAAVKTVVSAPVKTPTKAAAKAPAKTAPAAAKSTAKAVEKAPVAAASKIKAAATKAVAKPLEVVKEAPATPVRAVPAVVAVPSVPAKAGRPSSRLAQLTVPSMAQTVASTAAKASYNQTMSAPVIAPVIPAIVKKDAKLANNWKSKTVTELSDAELLAMPDSEYMNEVQLAYFRLKLSNLKRDILTSAGETTEHLREDTSVVPDPADRATIEEEHALELRTRDRERKLLKKIEQSIARIDAGDYGYCDETGEPIGVGRLLARPTATLSLEAQQRRELKQKMFGD
ncbi:RNA polymerase-binding transcription factor DksA [Curvibacter sp. AEP1-3]|nr:RNA polymerase-binding transcription factor DksA [Curvibacter sp. AEP1-3]